VGVLRNEGTASERLRLWGRELFYELLPEQETPETPRLLACDDETVRIVADRLGFEFVDPSVQFGHDVRVGFEVGKTAGWKLVTAGAWGSAAPPRPLPVFFPVLCLWVLAASRMTQDDKHPTMEYHGRLCHLLGVSGDDSLPNFNFIGARFRDFAKWLADDMQGRHGHLLVPENPHPEHVGYAVEQTVFRLRDRQVLSVFFAERLGGSLDGFDPLRRLQRWSGRGQLTGHAQRILENPRFEERVRAAVRAAFQSWDGAELVEVAGRGFGRFWPARIRLLIYPQPSLQFGATNPKPVELTLDGEQQTLAVGRELPLPWALVARGEERTIDLGDPVSDPGGVRLPCLGKTILFEDGDEGLLRVEQPSAEKVWVLSHDGALQGRLAQRRFNDRDRLPFGWELFYEVPVDELPGVERAAIAQPQLAPLRMEGGLPLGRPRYLSGHPPYLAAGDLETDEQLSVKVNDVAVGTIGSSGRLLLPGEPGRYEIDVEDGEFHASYDVEQHGEPAELRLYHRLDSDRALRVGARPVQGEPEGVCVCGATMTPPYSGAVPFLTRVLSNVETICRHGGLVRHTRPSTPSWFKDVGLHERGRWELFCEQPPVWLLLPPAGGKPRVRLLADIELGALEGEAAARVLALGADVDLMRGAVDPTATREHWQALLEVAKAASARTVPA
jgi:hypothetical protein